MTLLYNMNASNIAQLLGTSSPEAVEGFVNGCTQETLSPENKTYPDATYVNYHPLGLSFCYSSDSSTASSSRSLSYIDIFNPPASGRPARSRRKEAWFGFSPPSFPITFSFPSGNIPIPPAQHRAGEATSSGGTKDTLERNKTFEVGPKTTGKEFVDHFGEPSKKSAGEPGYVPPFLEWNSIDIVDGDGTVLPVGILIELRDPGVTEGMGGARTETGATVWDRAGSWTWSSLKLFVPEKDGAMG